MVGDSVESSTHGGWPRAGPPPTRPRPQKFPHPPSMPKSPASQPNRRPRQHNIASFTVLYAPETALAGRGADGSSSPRSLELAALAGVRPVLARLARGLPQQASTSDRDAAVRTRVVTGFQPQRAATTTGLRARPHGFGPS
jgi:hypothetical protein